MYLRMEHLWEAGDLSSRSKRGETRVHSTKYKGLWNQMLSGTIALASEIIAVYTINYLMDQRVPS